MREDFDCAHVLDVSLLAEVRPTTAFRVCKCRTMGCCTCMQVRWVILPQPQAMTWYTLPQQGKRAEPCFV